MKKVLWFLGLGLLLAGCASGPRTSAPPSAKDEPKGLTSLTAATLSATYGAASFVRKENGTEMWRYDVGACRIFFFLYPQNGALSVRHVESVPRGKTVSVDQNCLNALDVRAKRS